jgi:hypothetical protein
LVSALLLASFQPDSVAQPMSRQKEACSVSVGAWDRASGYTEQEIADLVGQALAHRFQFVAPNEEAFKSIRIWYDIGQVRIKISDLAQDRAVEACVDVHPTKVDYRQRLAREVTAKLNGLVTKSFPLTARIVAVDGNRASIDQGRNLGFRPGMLLDASRDGRRVGLLRLESVQEGGSVGVILKGGRAVVEGTGVVEYVPPAGALGFSATYRPSVSVEPNPRYLGPAPNPINGTAWFGKVMYLRRYRGWGWDGALGVCDMPLARAFHGDVDLFAAHTIVPERLELQAGGGGGFGFGFLGEQYWARRPGTYDDGNTVHSGWARAFLTESYQGFAGIAVHLNRSSSICARYGYYGFATDFWQETELKDNSATEGEDKTMWIESEWLEYSRAPRPGWALQLALLFWL